MNPRILFVDDEDSIRLTLSALLQSKGFEVTTAATVQDALALIMQQKFDVLIADLNISMPGDGFTVISAMRSAQPEALRLILTGFPDFESALRAIQEQVHEYVIKPAEIDELVAKIRTWSSVKPAKAPEPQRIRLAEIIRDNRTSITAEWLKLVNSDLDMKAIELTDAERRNNLDSILDLIASVAEGRILDPENMTSAAEHGRLRQQQGYSIPLIVREGRFLIDALVGCVQKRILSIDLSTLIVDLRRVFTAVEILLEESTRSFLQTGALQSQTATPSLRVKTSKRARQ
jgi:DNA-binding response OmpR family regulator